MKNIKWKFIDDSKEVSGGFDIILTPRVDSLRFFLLVTPLEKIPDFIKGMLNSEGGGGDQLTYVETFSNLDCGDFAVGNGFNQDEIKVIHHVFGDVILKEKLFCNILYEFGLEVLKRNRNNKKLRREWKEEMKEALDKLKK